MGRTICHTKGKEVLSDQHIGNHNGGNDNAKLNVSTESRKRKAAVGGGKSTTKTPKKGLDLKEAGSGASEVLPKPPMAIKASARFEEDRNLVEVEVNAPINEFLSEGEVTGESSSSEDDSDEGEASSQDSQMSAGLAANNNAVADGDGNYQDDYDYDDNENEVVFSQRTKDMMHRERMEKQWLESRHVQMENKLDSLTNALAAVQDMIKKSVAFSPHNNKGKQKGKKTSKVPSRGSETTIYKNAVDQVNAGSMDSELNRDILQLHLSAMKHISSSSDEVDTSDELIDLANVISGESGASVDKDGAVGGEPQPSTSMGPRNYRDPVPQLAQQVELTHAEQMIKDAEASKKRMLGTKGEETSLLPLSFVHSVLVDEEYLVIGSHVGESVY